MLVPDMPTRIYWQFALNQLIALTRSNNALFIGTFYKKCHNVPPYLNQYLASLNCLGLEIISRLSGTCLFLHCRTFSHSDSYSFPFRNITSIYICQAGVLCQASSWQAITHWISLATLMAASGLDWNIISRLYTSNHQITSGWWCGLLPLTICCDQPVIFLTPALRCSCQQH